MLKIKTKFFITFTFKFFSLCYNSQYLNGLLLRFITHGKDLLFKNCFWLSIRVSYDIYTYNEM